MNPEARVGIVGGGILGMTVAWRLAKLGFRVKLYEADNQCGGLAQSWQVGDVVWDRHYHVTLLSDQDLRGLLTELEIENEIIWREAKSGFFGAGQLCPLAGPIDYLRLPTMSLIAKLRLACSLVYASKIREWRYLDGLSAESWLSHISGIEAWNNLWAPLLRAKVGDNYNTVSAAFIWSIIARLVKARRMGYVKDLFGYLPGGYARTLSVFETHLQKAGVEISRGDAITSVRAVSSDAGSLVEVETASRGKEIFDKVVVTIPPALASQIVKGLSRPELDSWEQIKYQGIVCPAMLLRRPLAGYYLTYITDPRIPFTSVIEMSALVDAAQFSGRAYVYLPCYVNPTSDLFEASEESIRETFLNGLRVIFPDFRNSDIEAWRLSRVRHVFAISTPNYADRVPGFATSVEGVYMVNSSQIVNGTLNVNETVQLANRAAKEISTFRDLGLQYDA